MRRISKDCLSIILSLKHFSYPELLRLQLVSKKFRNAILRQSSVSRLMEATARIKSDQHARWWGRQLWQYQSPQLIKSFILWEQCFLKVAADDRDYPIIRRVLDEGGDGNNRCEYFVIPGMEQTTWPEKLVVVGFVTLGNAAHFALICDEERIAFACRAGDDGALEAAKRLLQLLTSEVNPIGFDVTFEGSDIEQSVRNWYTRL